MEPRQSESNMQKHGVSFQEAATVFGDSLSYTFDDPDHSGEEVRFLTIGLATTGKLLIVSHTDREDNIRIISARELTKSERKFYEEGG
jgi:uncharacterized protein